MCACCLVFKTMQQGKWEFQNTDLSIAPFGLEASIRVPLLFTLRTANALNGPQVSSWSASPFFPSIPACHAHPLHPGLSYDFILAMMPSRTKQSHTLCVESASLPTSPGEPLMGVPMSLHQERLTLTLTGSVPRISHMCKCPAHSNRHRSNLPLVCAICSLMVVLYWQLHPPCGSFLPQLDEPPLNAGPSLTHSSPSEGLAYCWCLVVVGIVSRV